MVNREDIPSNWVFIVFRVTIVGGKEAIMSRVKNWTIWVPGKGIVSGTEGCFNIIVFTFVYLPQSRHCDGDHRPVIPQQNEAVLLNMSVTENVGIKAKGYYIL